MLYGAGYEKGSRNIAQEELGRCALTISGLEGVIWLMAGLQMESEPQMMAVIGSSLRPVLYGLCIWAACQAKTEEKTLENPQSMDDYYQLFGQAGLTGRETEIAILVVKGMTNAEIAWELSIAESTVKKHMSSILDKLQVKNREEVRRYGTAGAEKKQSGAED